MSHKNWDGPHVGTTGTGRTVTAAFGTGPNQGETLLGDGDRTGGNFMTDSSQHDHYGSGNGPNDNGTDRGAYTGSGSTSRSG